jgi:hypothetical protein
MFELEQRLGGQVPAELVVEAEAAVGETAHLAVHDDERRLLVVVLREESVGQRLGVHDERVAVAAHQEPDGIAFLSLVIVAGGDQHEFAGRLEGFLDGAEHGAEERALQLGHQHAHRVRTARGQRLRDGIGLVAELFHGGEDFLSGLFADLGARIDDARDGGERDPGQLGHFIDVRHCVPWAALFCPQSRST